MKEGIAMTRRKKRRKNLKGQILSFCAAIAFLAAIALFAIYLRSYIDDRMILKDQDERCAETDLLPLPHRVCGGSGTRTPRRGAVYRALSDQSGCDRLDHRRQ